MNYNKIIFDNVKEEDLLHAAIQDLKREYNALAKSVAQGNEGGVALVVGAMEREIGILSYIDEKKNGDKNSVNVA